MQVHQAQSLLLLLGASAATRLAHLLCLASLLDTVDHLLSARVQVGQPLGRILESFLLLNQQLRFLCNTHRKYHHYALASPRLASPRARPTRAA